METYDFVIVGGGSAGAVLAARLSSDASARVLLVEAGGMVRAPTEADLLSNVTFALTARDWGLQARVDAERRIDYPQGRTLGGGSSVNGALALRGLPDDYDGWVAEGNTGWGYDDLLPYFRRLEADADLAGALHGTGGPVPIRRHAESEWVPVQQAFRSACIDLGMPATTDHNDPSVLGVGPVPMNRSADGLRMSTALTYLAPVLTRRNLTVWCDTLVHEVTIRSGRATGIVIDRGTGPEHVVAGEVVLCGGAVQSPALLWRSGVGPAGPLTDLGIVTRFDAPAVGTGLMEHPGAFVFVAPREGAIDRDGPQFQLAAKATSSGSAQRGDLLVSMMNFWDLSATPDFQRLVGAPFATVITCGVHYPESRGSVRLVSAEPGVAPEIDLNLLDHPADRARLRDALRTCAAIARSGAMAPFVRSIALLDDAALDDDAAMDAYARSMVAPWYHASGTCPMGAVDRGGVVDHELRVHGIDGLRVVDASVMPRIPRAPTNLTVIAIAERAADLMV